MQAVAAADRGPAVHYTLCVDGFPATAWLVARLELDEVLSQPYELRLELASSEAEEAASGLLAARCVVTLGRGGQERRVCGVILAFELLGRHEGVLRVAVVVVPAITLLGQNLDSRIFQEESVPDIVRAVLEAGLSGLGGELRLELRRDYRVREYVVQYDESDLQFVTRLLAEEGITYYFEHGEEHEILVLVDEDASFVDGGEIMLARRHDVHGSGQAISSFVWRERLTASRVQLREHDWTRPGVAFAAECSDDHGGSPRELYLHSDRAAFGGYDEGSGRYRSDLLRQRSGDLLEGQRVAAGVGLGDSDVCVLAAGHTFELVDHEATSLDQAYLVTRVQHRGRSDALLEAIRADGPVYANRFEVIPRSRRFRPPVRPRPRISGVHTAMVVGPDGEEIHTDRHGRIKVRFHWDRHGASDEHATCWLRVAQSWAGTGWGFVFVPRIGMEVVVAFVDGDPDRPLVVGCLYHGHNTPPYALPEAKTRSVLRTSSTPGGDGHNELSFDDAAGHELVFLRAQRDLRAEILHDAHRQVGHDDSLEVDHDRRRTVHGEQSLRVDGHDAQSVGGGRRIEIAGDRREQVGGDRGTRVDGGDTLSVGLDLAVGVTGSRAEIIGGSRTASVAGASGDQVAGDRSESTGGDASTHVAGALRLQVSKDAEVVVEGRSGVAVSKALALTAEDVSVVAKESFTLKVGEAQIVLRKNGDVVVKGGKIKIEATGTVALKGDKVTGN